MSGSPAIAPGVRLGPYTLVDSLGAGASATAWRARDAEGREVALKVRRAGVAQLDRRFLREFESMRVLRIPGVVRVFEAGIERDLLWFSMEIVRGLTFVEAISPDSDIKRRVKRTLALGRQLLDILAALHQAGLVHRDIKPSNVLVTEDGQVRVLDFGIARFHGETEHSMSDSGQVLGTIPFMAPEQVAALPIDHRIDLFAAGLMLYEAIDGPRPRPQTQVGWVPRICLERLVPLACKHKDVPRGLSKVIERLTEADPDDRPTAGDAARDLRRAAAGDPNADWPEPPWVERGDWLENLDQVCGQDGNDTLLIVEGAAGSGRRRIAEQIHRQAVMQGVRPLHLRCRPDAVGAPILALLEALLLGADPLELARTLLGNDADVLRRFWPQLPPPEGGAGAPPSVADLCAAAARAVLRGVPKRGLVVIVHDLELADEIVLNTLARLSQTPTKGLGIVLLHEPRWETSTTRAFVAQLRAKGARFRTIPPLAPDEALAIARALCPENPPDDVAAITPQRAVEAGLQALARWRREPWHLPDSGLWPFAVRDAPVPESVVIRISGPRALEDPRLKVVDGGITFAGATVRRTASCRLDDKADAARALAVAWEAELGSSADPADVASLALYADQRDQAHTPAARAAVAAERSGRYGEARRLLALADALGAESHLDADLRFDLAMARARIALRTEPGPPRIELVDAVEKLGRTPADDARARILRSEAALRAGDIRPALVSTLRLAGQLQNSLPVEAARALLFATEARIALGQLDDARSQLERARAMLADRGEPRLEVDLQNGLAEVLVRKGDLGGSRVLLQDTIRLAGEHGYVRGAAFAASRFARVLRAMGRRAEAELQMRSARDAFRTTADLAFDAEAGLDLAMLRVERGDAIGAHHLLDDAIRRAKAAGAGDRLLGRAMRVALAIAVVRADVSDAMMTLPVVETTGDPEGPAVTVRWFRTRGDSVRALEVKGPPKDQVFGLALWKIERARAALAAGAPWSADTDADEALDISMKARLGELAVLARLVLGVIRPIDDATWKDLSRQAAASLFTEVFLGALELDARRLAAHGDIEGARRQWVALRARAEELGHRAAVEEANGWLAPRET